jgi:mRNA interferase RelE/StbE
MRVGFRAAFLKDLDAIQDQRMLQRLERVIRTLERAASLPEVPQVKRLRGHPDSYRIRIGDFRLGLQLVGQQVECVRFLHRREIYRFFP